MVVTLDQLKAMDIPLKPVPRLARSTGSSSGAPPAPVVDLTPVLDRTRAVEDGLAAMREHVATAAALVQTVAGMKTMLEKLTTSTAAAAATAQAHTNCEAAEAATSATPKTATAKATGKRKRRA